MVRVPIDVEVDVIEVQIDVDVAAVAGTVAPESRSQSVEVVSATQEAAAEPGSVVFREKG